MHDACSGRRERSQARRWSGGMGRWGDGAVGRRFDGRSGAEAGGRVIEYGASALVTAKLQSTAHQSAREGDVFSVSAVTGGLSKAGSGCQ